LYIGLFIRNGILFRKTDLSSAGIQLATIFSKYAAQLSCSFQNRGSHPPEFNFEDKLKKTSGLREERPSTFSVLSPTFSLHYISLVHSTFELHRKKCCTSACTTCDSLGGKPFKRKHFVTEKDCTGGVNEWR